MASSRATINVALCYNICSDMQGSSDAEKDLSHEKTRRPRLPLGPADHGAARFAGAALEFADHLGAAGAAADVARLACGLRRGLADRPSGPAVGSAAGGARRAHAPRISPHAAGEGIARNPA